jgi:hypothetical protein
MVAGVARPIVCAAASCRCVCVSGSVLVDGLKEHVLNQTSAQTNCACLYCRRRRSNSGLPSNSQFGSVRVPGSQEDDDNLFGTPGLHATTSPSGVNVPGAADFQVCGCACARACACFYKCIHVCECGREGRRMASMYVGTFHSRLRCAVLLLRSV